MKFGLGDDYYDIVNRMSADITNHLQKVGVNREFRHAETLYKAYTEHTSDLSAIPTIDTSQVRFHRTPTRIAYDQELALKTAEELRQLQFEEPIICEWFNSIGEEYRRWYMGPQKEPLPGTKPIHFIPPEAVSTPLRLCLSASTSPLYCLSAAIPFGRSMEEIHMFYVSVVMHMLSSVEEDLKALERPIYFAHHITKHDKLYLFLT